MSENKVIWHPYPQEKPKRAREFYLVTTDVISNDIDIDYFNQLNQFADKNVIAWAELPEPYNPEER